eukprot:TRINITY_DN55032_c0_g1_i1.p1 TRINITY_DN55032_c0_g1~~TRINITY_DN55032_c0_g1_i1.p1  ORF type:complete len:415 (+),score=72.92 TRINITY_DN55032_c0_g1_i1:194-1438(+)
MCIRDRYGERHSRHRMAVSVRAVTNFVVLPPDQDAWPDILIPAANLCAKLAQKFEGVGYTVQTLRIVTNPFGEYLDTTSTMTAIDGLKVLATILESNHMPQQVRIRFAIGAARNVHELDLVPALIEQAMDLANCCVNIPCNSFGMPDPELTMAAARCCAELALRTPRGEGNFNFTANFNMAPGCPYFPAAYNLNDCGPNFAIGLEYPDLLLQTLAHSESASWDDRMETLHQAIEPHITRLNQLAKAYAQETGVRFAGMDTSAAPSKQTASLATVCEALGLLRFGAAGTVQCCAFLTKLFKSFGEDGVDLVGFSGLMLACLEDTGLAEAAAAGWYDIRALMTYSAVCGIGLDTVPIPGESTPDQIAALMADTGTMAFRLNKPLTVRLFPCHGLKAGDITQFSSQDLCNCAVFALP